MSEKTNWADLDTPSPRSEDLEVDSPSSPGGGGGEQEDHHGLVLPVQPPVDQPSLVSEQYQDFNGKFNFNFR